MTPEQLAAHNMLTHRLWPEWEEFCRVFAAAKGDKVVGISAAMNAWGRKVEQVHGHRGNWVNGLFAWSDYEIDGERYVWIETK